MPRHMQHTAIRAQIHTCTRSWTLTSQAQTHTLVDAHSEHVNLNSHWAWCLKFYRSQPQLIRAHVHLFGAEAEKSRIEILCSEVSGWMCNCSVSLFSVEYPSEAKFYIWAIREWDEETDTTLSSTRGCQATGRSTSELLHRASAQQTFSQHILPFFISVSVQMKIQHVKNISQRRSFILWWSITVVAFPWFLIRHSSNTYKHK